MKKIYINNMKRAVIFGESVLLPGSNLVEEIDPKKFPSIEKYIDNDDIEVSEDPASAVKKANTQKAVDDIASTEPENETLQKNAGKRKGALDKLDAEAKAAAAKKNKKETEAEENGTEE